MAPRSRHRADAGGAIAALSARHHLSRLRIASQDSHRPCGREGGVLAIDVRMNRSIRTDSLPRPLSRTMHPRQVARRAAREQRIDGEAGGNPVVPPVRLPTSVLALHRAEVFATGRFEPADSRDRRGYASMAALPSVGRRGLGFLRGREITGDAVVGLPMRGSSTDVDDRCRHAVPAASASAAGHRPGSGSGPVFRGSPPTARRVELVATRPEESREGGVRIVIRHHDRPVDAGRFILPWRGRAEGCRDRQRNDRWGSDRRLPGMRRRVRAPIDEDAMVPTPPAARSSTRFELPIAGWDSAKCRNLPAVLDNGHRASRRRCELHDERQGPLAEVVEQLWPRYPLEAEVGVAGLT